MSKVVLVLMLLGNTGDSAIGYVPFQSYEKCWASSARPLTDHYKGYEVQSVCMDPSKLQPLKK